MVADGSGQERSMDTQTSSPTISTEALFLSAAVDAYECRKVVTVDIEGAYFSLLLSMPMSVERW
jgi:hypothetical protein